MLFLATVALLAVGAEISARSSSRESVRPPCPAGMIRAGNAVRTGYSADKVHGVHAGENMPDSALGMLRRFYEEYIAAWLRNGDNEEGLAILRRYLTPRLFGRLQRMYAEMELDYDPFLEATAMKVCWKISVSKRIPFGRMFTGSCCGIISTGNTGKPNCCSGTGRTDTGSTASSPCRIAIPAIRTEEFQSRFYIFVSRNNYSVNPKTLL